MQQPQETSTKNTIENGTFTWKSPSNIALVKYWGKHGLQLPSNPSISFTLNESYTQTSLEYSKKENDGNFDVTVFLDEDRNEKFEQKILVFLDKIKAELPLVSDYSFTLKTHNSFPHSSGIASSASGMSALSLCLLSLQGLVSPIVDKEEFLQKASYFSRIGSGSASRSVYGGLVVWGRHAEIINSSDEYATPYPFEVDPVFETFNDTILLIHEGEKNISSTVGHSLMNTHPFAQQRFEEARVNLSRLVSVFRSGDLEEFGQIVEQEAMMLHALMMCSTPPYILMKPNTLAVIEKIWDFRKQNNVPLFFTLDAGANVHVLYPENDKTMVNGFIENELAGYCENKKYICDCVGNGPELITK
jgi:diphosphomevalonate decarboxylase